MYVVRLSDGYSWLLAGKSAAPYEGWSRPLVLTCDELFASIDTAPTPRILRIRLDSLGPGTPPD